MTEYEVHQLIKSAETDKTTAEYVGRTLGQMGVPLPYNPPLSIPAQDNLKKGYWDTNNS